MIICFMCIQDTLGTDLMETTIDCRIISSAFIWAVVIEQDKWFLIQGVEVCLELRRPGCTIHRIIDSSKILEHLFLTVIDIDACLLATHKFHFCLEHLIKIILVRDVECHRTVFELERHQHRTIHQGCLIERI